MGVANEVNLACETVNKAVSQAALHRRKKVTLDIDATEAVANKVDAHWTCNKCKGYMPMVGHIAETGQIVSCYSRQGNAAPAKENFEHWYYQRVEDSANRIKQPKLDFGGNTMACSDFNANTL